MIPMSITKDRYLADESCSCEEFVYADKRQTRPKAHIVSVDTVEPCRDGPYHPVGLPVHPCVVPPHLARLRQLLDLVDHCYRLLGVAGHHEFHM